MKAPFDPSRRGLSLQFKLGESVTLEFAGQKVKLTVYETKGKSCRITFTAESEVKIQRNRKEKKGLLS